MKNQALSMFDDGILKPHNQVVYLKILDGLLTSNKVLVEQATGTGKSYLAMKYVHDFALNNGKKVLFVSPTNIIQDAFIDNCANVLGYGKNGNYNIDLTTSLYAGLKSEINNHYDIIILDEVHRIGADVWGQSVKELLENNKGATVLGLTATLDRADGIDIRQFFDNQEPVSRISLIDAINEHILPTPDYTLAKIDFSEDAEFIDKATSDLMEKMRHSTRSEKAQITKHLADLAEAKKIISQSKELPRIFAEELNTPALRKGKYIVFCIGGQTESERLIMEQMAMQSHYWFKDVAGNPSVKTYAVHSTYGNDYNAEQIEAFEQDNSDSIKLLFSVNMLNEGKHVEDIDGVIMFRPTSSRVIYLQQLGRALSVGHNDHPKIFDFVANLDMERVVEIKSALTAESESNTELGEESGEGAKKSNGTQIFNIDIKNLQEIEFINTLKQNIYQFNESFGFDVFYSHLLEYKEQNGDILVPRRFLSADGYNLGLRVSRKRQSYKQGKLPKAQVEKLNEIGFVWDVHADAFEEFYSHLLEYKEQNGDLQVPQSFISPDSYNLGKQVAHKRNDYKEGKLTQEQIEKLNAIGFVWDASVDSDKIFKDFYSHLLEYKEQNGNLQVSQRFVSLDGYKLGRQVSRKRNDYKKGKVPQEQIDKLNAIGFIWDVSKKKTNDPQM